MQNSQCFFIAKYILNWLASNVARHAIIDSGGTKWKMLYDHTFIVTGTNIQGFGRSAQ